MLLDRPLVQSHRVADVCVRIDETGNQISPAHIDSSRPGGRTEIGAHRRDPPVPNDDVNVLERLLAFRRNERGVLDDDTVQHDRRRGLGAGRDDEHNRDRKGSCRGTQRFAWELQHRFALVGLRHPVPDADLPGQSLLCRRRVHNRVTGDTLLGSQGSHQGQEPCQKRDRHGQIHALSPVPGPHT